MINGNIAIIDSGIGGLNLLYALDKKLNSTRFFYFGDNDNAPYGNKSINNLWSLTIENLLFLKQFDIDYLLLGCNTLSVNLLNKIQDFIGVETIGVFPPVESVFINKNKTLLLSTVATSKKYRKNSFLTPLGLPYLAGEIERKVFSLKSINLNHHIPLSIYRKNYFDSVILGCTHYDFIKNEIFDHLKPQNIISGIDYTILYVLKKLKTIKSLDKTYQNEIIFIGKNASVNKKIYYEVVKNSKKI